MTDQSDVAIFSEQEDEYDNAYNLIDRLKFELPQRSYIAAGLKGFQRFEADNNPTAGADHVRST